MSVNKYLKTSNVILNTLNENYYVSQQGILTGKGVKGVYDVYAQPEGGGIDFLCSLTIKPTAKKSVIFNDKTYKDIDTLFADMDAFNKTRLFPSFCYDPMKYPHANEECKIDWYLRTKLGMTVHWNNNLDTYCLRNATGDEIFRISYEMDYHRKNSNEKDVISGYLMRDLGGSSWVKLDFKDAEDAVSMINSFLSIQIVTDLNRHFDVLSKLSGSFNSLKDANIVSIENFLSGRKEDYREKVLPILKELISKFESDVD